MSEKMTREDIVRMAHESGFTKGPEPHSVVVRHSNGSWVGVYAELNVFAHKIIEHFLTTTGQYVTNDASREAAIKDAVEAEREACATICDELESYWAAEKDVALLNGDVDLSNASSGEPRAARAIATAIRARGEK